jgi:hypothetical protein
MEARVWMTAAEIETAPHGWYICYWNGRTEESENVEVLIGPFASAGQAEASALENERIELSTVSMEYQSIEER